jgi:hypothetical protein
MQSNRTIHRFEHNGTQYEVVPHDDGSYSLSEDGSPQPLLIAGSMDEILRYVQNRFGEIDWLPE